MIIMGIIVDETFALLILQLLRRPKLLDKLSMASYTEMHR